MFFRNNFLLNLFFFFLGIIFIHIYISVILTGKISDAQLYYNFYNSVSENGYFAFLISQYDNAGKVEPAIYFLYSLLPSELSFEVFIFINYFILLIIIFFIYTAINKKYFFVNNVKNIFYFLFLIFFWYPTYSNLLWVWRSFFAIVLIVLSLYLFNKMIKYIIGFFAISFHFSSILYLLIIFFIDNILDFIKKLNYYYLAIIMIFIGIFLGLFVKIFFNYFSFLSSGDMNWTENSDNLNYIGGAISLYLLLLLVPFITLKNKNLHNQENLFVLFISIMLVSNSFCIVFFNNHFIVHRVFIFSSFLFIPFFITFKGYLTIESRWIVTVLVFIGVLPTLNSIFRYLYD